MLEADEHTRTMKALDKSMAYLEAELIKCDALCAGPDATPAPLPDSPDPIYNELLDIYKAYIQLEHDAGWDAARRDQINAQSIAFKAYSLRDALGELIQKLFVELNKGVKRSGWTAKNISRWEHLIRRCEQLPIESESEQALDLLDEYRAHAVPNEKKF